MIKLVPRFSVYVRAWAKTQESGLQSITPLFLGFLLIVANASISAADSLSIGPAKPFPQVVREAKDALVFVQVSTNVDTLVIQATGFIVLPSLLMTTCAHPFFDQDTIGSTVIIPDTSRILVQFQNAKRGFRAQLVTHRRDRDVALLQVIPNQSGLDSVAVRPLLLAKTQELEEGLEIAVSGYDLSGQPVKMFGQIRHRATTHKGIVSSLLLVGPSGEPEFVDSFQADMLVNRGVSGAPVYRASDGQVVGMVKSFQGKEISGVPVNFGLVNCVPAWAIATILFDIAPPDNAPKTQ